MLTHWRNWCRLCARDFETGIDLFFKLESDTDLSQTVQKFFNVTITPYDDGPRTICENCFHFLIRLRRFADRCVKADLMFSEFLYVRINSETTEEHDLIAARMKFGLDEEEKYSEYVTASTTVIDPISTPIIPKLDQGTDTKDLIVVESTTFEDGKKNSTIQKWVDQRKLTKPPSQESIELKEEITDSDPDYFAEHADEHSSDESAFEEDGEIPDHELHNVCENENESLEIDQYIETQVDLDIEEPGSTRKRSPGVRRYGGAKRTTCRNHIKMKHENMELNYGCANCPKKFATDKRLKQHERVHLPESEKMVHPCPYCDKKFSKDVNVQAHVRSVHRGERPFVCEECGKSFGTKGTLKEHQITHSDERPYQCSYCPKKFKNMPRLKTHEDIHNDTMYVCIHCGLQLNTKRTLKMHMVVHSDTKKYKCHYCGNEYKRSKALKNHLILHTGLRPYACPFCDKTFANGSNCRSHKKKAHPAELAAAEAAGETSRVTNMPKLEHLQPKYTEVQHQAAGINPSLVPIGSTVVESLEMSPEMQPSPHPSQPQAIQLHPVQLSNSVQISPGVDLSNSPHPVPLLSTSSM